MSHAVRDPSYRSIGMLRTKGAKHFDETAVQAGPKLANYGTILKSRDVRNAPC
jgi:hypothetical protein